MNSAIEYLAVASAFGNKVSPIHSPREAYALQSRGWSMGNDTTCIKCGLDYVFGRSLDAEGTQGRRVVRQEEDWGDTGSVTTSASGATRCRDDARRMPDNRSAVYGHARAFGPALQSLRRMPLVRGAAIDHCALASTYAACRSSAVTAPSVSRTMESCKLRGMF